MMLINLHDWRLAELFQEWRYRYDILFDFASTLSEVLLLDIVIIIVRYLQLYLGRLQFTLFVMFALINHMSAIDIF
jgi:hypothetical protein